MIICLFVKKIYLKDIYSDGIHHEYISQTSDIRDTTLLGDKVVDHLDVAGALFD